MTNRPPDNADMNSYECQRDEFVVSTDRARLDLDVIHAFLRQSYWSPGIPREMVERSIKNSLCFGVFKGTQQVGFARVITDRTTFAYLADVFILEPYRGIGLSKFLMECISKHPDLQNLRRWMLATRDAHGLYVSFGFTPLKHPERFMERHDPNVYARTRE
ncbi:MAG TPA: GNAT family N-acetyltransferase [Terriglobales bacterium]|nr:GNAT family N-acetyltransferase [Terriglobales bacterium]